MGGGWQDMISCGEFDCVKVALAEIYQKFLETLRQKLRTMLNVFAVFIIFAMSRHHHSYTGFLHICQIILKAINIGAIIFNYSW
jgi:hypothetical protein